jgi:S-DNA-T family DNA segregation ATPase FtsK/SpoIIIE
MAVEYIDRPPRIQPELPVGEVQIPNPPAEDKNSNQALMTLLLPVVTIVGFVFASGGGNVLLIIPMGLAMVLSIGASLYSAHQQEQVFAAKKKAYTEMLSQMRQDMVRSHNTQRQFYLHNYPDINTILDIAARTERSRFGSRLWERRASDSDFGALRLGIGSRPSTVVYKVGQGGASDDSPLLKDAQQLSIDSQTLTDAPITIPLRPVAEKREQAEGGSPNPTASAVPARHSIGMFGKNPTNIADFARAALTHFTAFHSALDTRLYVIGLPENRPNWQWAEWLPHCTTRGVGDDDADSAGQPKEYDQLCFSNDKQKVSEFWKRIKRELDSRQVRMRDAGQDGHVDVSLPFVLVVVDLLGEVPPFSPLKEVAAEAVVATINQAGPVLGAGIIFLSKDPARIPSDCVAMVEVAAVGGKVVFRYTEVGLNTPRHIGEADVINAADARQKFAAQIRRLDLRRSFGADLPRSVNLLEMQGLLESRKIDTVDKITIKENWERSMRPENSEWLSVPIGLISLREVRNLVFSAKEGGDGVHGMIAGTTGSGKSELLLTLIAGLAAKYDPRIVNFVLVDFKGGAAFEPFKKLPHCVDILTNLQANAVSRMFVAIQAVMEQRAAILARSNAKDLVDYRKKVIPRLKPDDPLPHTFPHLFIIVDEFAEMIVQNPEYKAQFESVTRLGRAFGVSLLLATQRPAGVVTDQMRSNMKFRVCLRVETPDDSKELLGRPDAAFLPNMGGRGYIQVGNDILTAIQVARAGGDYSDDRLETLRDVIWLDEEPMPRQAAGGSQAMYSGTEIAEALGLKPDEKAATLVDWVVGITALRAKRDGVPVQTKPWPNPLPAHLTLTEPVDAQYLNTERDLGADRTIVLNPPVQAWLHNTDEKPLWQPVDWKSPPPLRVDIGLIDNPYRAEQRILTIDLTSDPMVLFGASGRGKTTFIKSLLLALAAQRSPNELHMFAFDFGRGGLKTIKDLPHLGAAVDASEVARVDQLMRMLRNIVNERQERLAKYNSLADFNAKNPNTPFAEVVVVIDNFAEFKESFEHQITELMALIRDGRAFGVYFVITASSTGDLTGKLLNLLTQRLALTMADNMQYSEIVGSGWRAFDNVPGRGLIAIPAKDKPLPVEFQVGMPGRAGQAADVDQPDPYQQIGQRMEKIWLAMGGKRPAAELPRSVTFLELFSLVDARKEEYIGDLGIGEKWKESMLPENQEWLKAPLGLISSKEVRTLIFSAKANGDGVHGMIAGTTGSGKSELLLSMIAAMAVKYDPRIVNFVLVDFKGGAAFEPFKKLPHCVDIATNLQGNAVERIFIAIKAEMDRRAKLLADGRVGDLVDYRKRVIPKLRPGDPLPNTFPHLFVIVDEFAEMIAQNPEYKAQFESITRLGRAFGVTLILATQRPAGAVTDQMRSNMKFRICLRVETTDDSKELLKRPDAATLPAIGGRGYIQVGGGSLTEIQVAWAGAEWSDAKPDPVYTTDEILEAMNLKPENKPGLLIDWIVGATAAEAHRQGIPKQYKPWPNPLPETLPLNHPIDATYLDGGHGGPEIVLNPEIAAWMENADNKPLWPEVDWQTALNVRSKIGLVDNPYRAEQRVLTLDLGSDPLVVFGSAGRGKSTFIKSLLITLAAQHSPSELHMYALDFARGGLKALKSLPHMAGIVDLNEEERVERLLRMVRNTIEERQNKIQAYDSLTDYNIKNPDSAFPAVVVVIDNISEFRETYERFAGDLMTMIRDGRSFGVYFVVTASLNADVPSKLFSLLGQRITFTMSDPTDYTTIMGRGWVRFNDVPGRGLALQMIGDRAVPLEFQTAVPVGEGAGGDAFRELAERMAAAWQTLEAANPALKARKPKRVEPLPKLVPLQSVLPEFGKGRPNLGVPVGINDLDREPMRVEFMTKGPHWIVIGPPVTGKTTVLRSLVLSLAHSYTPDQVALVLVDPSDTVRRFYNFGGSGENTLANLPHVLATVSTGKELEVVIKRLHAEYTEQVVNRLRGHTEVFVPQDNQARHIFVIIDHYDDAAPLNQGPGLAALAEVGKGKNMHLVIGGTLGIMRSGGDELRRRAESARYTLVLQDYETVRYMGAKGNFTVTREPPPGRGYQIKAVSAALVQIAQADVDGVDGRTAQDQLNRLIGAVRASYQPAKWSYYAADIAMLDKAIRGEVEAPAAVAAPPPTSQSTNDAMAAIAEMMKMQAGMSGLLGSVADANPARFASVEIPEAGNGQAAKGANGADGKPGNGAHAEQAGTNGTDGKPADGADTIGAGSAEPTKA